LRLRLRLLLLDALLLEAVALLARLALLTTLLRALRLAEVGEPVVHRRHKSSGSEEAVGLPLLAPARLVRVEEPARVLLHALASGRVGVGVRPALRADTERSRAGATGLTVALAGIEILAGGHLLLALITLVPSLDLVVARLGSELTGQGLQLLRGGILGLLGGLLGLESGALTARELGQLLLLPQLVQLTPGHAVELGIGQLEIGGRVEGVGAAAVTDGHLVVGL
jgi:hypothetical protein